jgi:hypothetical protein
LKVELKETVTIGSSQTCISFVSQTWTFDATARVVCGSSGGFGDSCGFAISCVHVDKNVVVNQMQDNPQWSAMCSGGHAGVPTCFSAQDVTTNGCISAEQGTGEFYQLNPQGNGKKAVATLSNPSRTICPVNTVFLLQNAPKSLPYYLKDYIFLFFFNLCSFLFQINSDFYADKENLVILSFNQNSGSVCGLGIVSIASKEFSFIPVTNSDLCDNVNAIFSA